MPSLQTVEQTTKRRGNGGNLPLGAIPVDPAVPAPALTDELANEIGESAYYRAQARGFEPGHELEDWVAAEQEVIALHGLVDDADRLAA